MPQGKKSGRAAKAARIQHLLSSQRRDGGSSPYRANSLARAYAFSLKDEARNTAHNRSAWDGDARLRNRPVGFISAGCIEPLERLQTVSATESNVFSEPDAATRTRPASPAASSEQSNPETKLSGLQDTRAPEVVGRDQPDNGEKEPPFFIDVLGDKDPSAGPLEIPRISSPHSCYGEPSSGDEDIVLFKGRVTKRCSTSTPAFTADEVNLQDGQSGVQRDASYRSEALFHQHSSKTAASPRDGDDDEDGEDSVLADYISNIANDDHGVPASLHRLSVRSLGGSDDEFSLGNPDAGRYGVIPCETATHMEYPCAPSPSQDTSTDGEGIANEIDDEDLARILAKQEELGLGGDELILFSPEFYRSMDRFGQPTSSVDRKLRVSEQHKTSRRQFSGATDLAEAFDNFDLVDCSPRRTSTKAKRKSSEISFELSDVELEESLRATWKKDRDRKKDRKREREELRKLGLLGKHANPNDPRVRYPAGMHLEDIKAELRAFLTGCDTSLTFPPMDASARKSIHELASRFKLKSKSTGSGDQRRPTLYRTKNTVGYVEREFEYLFARFGRHSFPRLDLKTKQTKKGTGNRGASHAAVTYKDGEIVGASAPELGQSNKGREMLEKMGWSSGMGLGAPDNKGILQPVAHVVKRSKAGLG
ncbi:Protein SQS1 [Pleurostoma richardsiae]|uniref:Protein SQS1 n=1 Tax=Pleurostoma richardsiae TaxID=41990 RepID=A0AA38RLP1_9PEZI|nr:Protein SQS1 [Pleurostoma richardsiae]